MATQVADGLADVERDLDAMLASPDDDKAIFLTISAGSGGHEACAWALMLLRMYEKYARRMGLESELMDIDPYEPDGVRSVTIKVSGKGAMKSFRQEAGIHRLSRVSPYDQADRRQTSFASVEVVAEVQEAELVVDAKEIEVWTCRGGGPGGQNVNRRETVACIKHVPTGIMVRCQNERSQAANKIIAMQLLMAKLAQKNQEDRMREDAKKRSITPKATFGGKSARTYVLSQHPAVHDHQTGKSTNQVEDVLDGNLSLLH